jgi:enamine deaminase RidA (YjgF/YER057c/UK114 family)
MQHAGTVGRNVSEEQACEAAEICVARTLAVARAGLGDLGRIARVIRLGVFVRCTPDYLWTSRIADAASKVMHQAFGDAGRHARSTVGVAALPGGACVEIEAVFGLYAAVHSASQGK